MIEEIVNSMTIPNKQKQIVITASDLFHKFGIKRVPIEEICQTAKVSKATFYKYFSNKTELIKYILTISSDAYLKMIDSIRALDIPYEQKIARWIDYKRVVTEQMSKHFIDEFYQASDELASFIKEKTAENYQKFFQFIQEGQEQGAIRSDLKSEFIIALLDHTNDLASDPRVRKLYTNYADLTKDLNDCFYFGISNKK